MKGGNCVFECKGCRKVASLVQEVEDIRQIKEDKRGIEWHDGKRRRRRAREC